MLPSVSLFFYRVKRLTNFLKSVERDALNSAVLFQDELFYFFFYFYFSFFLEAKKLALTFVTKQICANFVYPSTLNLPPLCFEYTLPLILLYMLHVHTNHQSLLQNFVYTHFTHGRNAALHTFGNRKIKEGYVI